MKRWFRQRWFNLRDGVRDRVWLFAAWLDPAVGNSHDERAIVMDELQRYAMVDMPLARRMPFIILASPIQIAEAALRRATREGFFPGDSLPDEAERAKEAVPLEEAKAIFGEDPR